jgi:murein DD-endopeptidase MepM/ murein hydrolase activator NlpD
MQTKPDFGPSALWTWPVLGASRLTQEFKPGKHYGVDIVGPEGAAVCAARSGRLWSCTLSPRGWSIVLDHGASRWATFYQHIETPAFDTTPPGSSVRQIEAGEALGTMGIDPLDPERVRHLHFECWYAGAGNKAAVDPQPEINSWRRLT